MAWRWNAQKVLSESEESRSHPDHIQHLITYCQHNSLLSQFPSGSQIELAKNMELVQLNKDQPVFSQGDAMTSSSFLYIILQGKLTVYRNEDFETLRKENETIAEWWSSSGGSIDNIFYGRQLGNVTRDAVCGENLLKISARPASILASENTLAIRIELGVLWHCLEEHPDVVITSKSILDIVKIKPGIEGRSYGDSMYLAGWLRQLRFFRQLPPNVLIMCSKHAYLKRYSNGTVIDEHHDQETMKNMYVIIKGTVEVRLMENKQKLQATGEYEVKMERASRNGM